MLNRHGQTLVRIWCCFIFKREFVISTRCSDTFLFVFVFLDMCVAYIFRDYKKILIIFPDEFTIREWYFGGKPNPDPYEMVPDGFVPTAEQIALVEALGDPAADAKYPAWEDIGTVLVLL